MPLQPYHPRDTQDSVLVNLLRDHLDAFIESAEADGGAGLPAFVERQLRAMVDCGDLRACESFPTHHLGAHAPR
jgi:hypothetical protein